MTNATSRRNLSLGLYFQHDQAITLSTSAGSKWHVPDEATLANASGAPLGTFQKPKKASVPSSSNRADDAWKDFILKSYFALYNVSTTFDFEFAYPTLEGSYLSLSDFDFGLLLGNLPLDVDFKVRVAVQVKNPRPPSYSLQDD